MKSFTWPQAREFYASLDNYFNQKWWFAIKSWMDTEGFCSFPASTKYHLKEDGGLLIHTMNVTRNALILNDAWQAGFPKWEVAAAGTLHDIGKMGVLLEDGILIPRYRRFRDDEKPEVPGQMWKYNEGCPHVSMSLFSILTVRRFVSLPFHVEQAICHHDGLYIDENKSQAHREGALQLILHYSDYYAGHCLEGNGFEFSGI